MQTTNVTGTMSAVNQMPMPTGMNPTMQACIDACNACLQACEELYKHKQTIE